MKLLVIGPKSFENDELKKEAVAKGHEVVLSFIKNISLIIKDSEMKAYYKGEVMRGFDVCLFRGINPYFAKAKTLAKYFHHDGATVIDRELYSRVYEFDKMFMSFEFFVKKLPCIDSFHFSTYLEFKKYLNKIPRPVFIKDIQGMHSRNMFYFKTKKGLNAFFEKNKKQVSKYLIQKVVGDDYYYRVLVVGDKVLGIMKRMSYLNPERKATKLEKRSFKGEESKELSELALSAARATHADIAGVDIIVENGEPKLLEVNRSPKFKRFTKVVGLNVASEIVGYLEGLK
jgi:glutathione synthase/RimK-type ligase-like ATP-grasp enzyme